MFTTNNTLFSQLGAGVLAFAITAATILFAAPSTSAEPPTLSE